MLHLLHVVPTYLPATRYGGPIHSVHGLCKALAALGHHVEVFTTNVDGTADSKVPLGCPVELDGVHVWYFPSRWLRRFYWSPAMAHQLREKIGNFDLVHLHSVFLWPTTKAASLARAAAVPYVLTPRGMLVRELIEQRSRFVKSTWIGLLERRNMRGAKFIHVTSEAEKQALCDLGLDLAPVRCVSNGVDPPDDWSWGELSDDIRRLSDLEPDLLCFGRISWKKALDRLIRSLTFVPDVTAVIAGNDDENHAVELRQIVRELELDKRVYILDRPIANADKEALFSAAKIFVLPSLSENFGNVVLEAMIRQRPVIVSQGVGASELVQASAAGLIFDGTPEDLGRKISSLIGATDSQGAMGQSGAKAARTSYTWPQIARQMVGLYENAIALD